MWAGHKKGLRARAKTALNGFTIDPKFAQGSFKAGNEASTTARGSPQNQPPMPGSCENKNGSRSKAGFRGLTVDTKLAREVYQAENSGVALNARMARKASYVEPPRLSEAMMNRNWRNPRHPLEESSPATTEALWSAPPEQSKFLDKAKVKPRRDDEYEVIDYDHDLARAAYRCRRPQDVKPELIPFTRSESVSADLCLSAPAAKTQFSAADMGTEERSEEYHFKELQPSIKSVVRLDQMVPTKDASYENILHWDENLITQKTRSHLRDSSSITIVTLADPSGDWETMEFPYAEIRPVKGKQRFEMGLNDVEETIRNQLAALVEPQTAGLPPEHLRREYEEMREARQRTMALAKSALGTDARRGILACDGGASGTEGTKDTQFNNLLGKLNNLCAPRLRAFTVNDKDDPEKHRCTNEPQNVTKGSIHSPSADSGVSGVSSGARQRYSKLNPAASEFRCTTLEKQSPATNRCESIVSGPAATVQTSKQAPEPTDPLRSLETRIAELEAQIARQESQHSQFARPRWDKRYKTNQEPYSTGYQSAYPPTYYSPPPNFAMGVGAVPPNPMPIAGYCALPQNGAALPPSGMPTAFLDPRHTTQGMTPFPVQGASIPTAPAAGTSLWVKSMFGPKPVSKPDRPFRPGDVGQAMRQNGYEEYLEHLRATDPNYALSCRQRQARRADRQRLGLQHGAGQGQGMIC
ncbi:hypothetical protein F5Y07DRAFT_410602 [Xylaria sp. FL0933]|nr:hypothetical protein F5Y07DRAFT_410602 [Xylaria sp. FL0933]